MSIDKISTEVEAQSGVLTVTMEALRDAVGAGKLGSGVCKNISDALRRTGIAHIPATLPHYQHELVRLYKRGTPAGEIIEKVLTPGEANDTALRERLDDDGPDYASIIEQVRELVSE